MKWCILVLTVLVALCLVHDVEAGKSKARKGHSNKSNNSKDSESRKSSRTNGSRSSSKKIDGGWTEWSNWGACTVTCGGGDVIRTRTCTDPAPENGGDDCVGSGTESFACSENPCPIDGVWTTWSVWSDCHVTCGGGITTKTRSCSNPAPAFGGDNCVGADAESEPCNCSPCPIDGVWTEWTDWSVCPVTCGGGTITRTRSCTNPAPANGGNNCAGDDSESQTCNDNSCPVNGGWTAWGDWGTCPVVCGGGTVTRGRACTNPAPAFGGDGCVGDDTESTVCGCDPCPVDGVWTEWTDWSVCPVTCGGGTITRLRFCANPAPAFGGDGCVGSPTEYLPCNTDPCPVDGGWTDFDEWSVCSQTCGGGTTTRTRACTNPAQANGGYDCVGDATESEPCSINPCPGAGCTKRWTKMYEHGPNGEYVYGDKTELIEAVSRGADIRLLLNDNFATSVQNVIPTSTGDLCAQALFNLAKTDYDTFQDDLFWSFSIACTNGVWYQAYYNVGEHVSRGINDTRSDITWFVRENCNAVPTLKVSATGDVISGSVSDIIAAASLGGDVRIRMESDGYTFPADNLHINPGQTFLSAQALWSVGQKLAPTGGHYIFKDNAYWLFTVTSSTAEQDDAKWSIGEHVNQGSTRHNVASSWFVDACWKEIYRHDANGSPLSGSFTALRDAVEAGHKVKIAYGGYSIQADDVVVRFGQVFAMLLNSVSKTQIKYLQSNAYWYWQIASTSGNIQTARYRVGDPVYVSGTTSAQKEITWYVDDTDWQPVLSVTQNGAVISGCKEALEHAIRNGADVRYKMVFPGVAGLSVIRGPDNLEISPDGNIGAMHFRSVAVKYTTTQMKFKSNIYWWFTVVTDTGRTDMSRWTVGAHVDRGHTIGTAVFDFFVNE